jgi:hypothetical protein
VYATMEALQGMKIPKKEITKRRAWNEKSYNFSN